MNRSTAARSAEIPSRWAYLFLLLVFFLKADLSVAQSVQPIPAKEEKALCSFLAAKFQHYSAKERADMHYSARMVDLNGDGKPEMLVYLRGSLVCGSGGCKLLILSPSGASFKAITETTVTRLPVQVLASTRNGWHDIAVFVAGGGTLPGYSAKLSFDGHRYPGNPSIPPAEQISGPVVGSIVIPSGDPGNPLYP